MPTHNKARKDGYVYIHQLQAEKKLGRPLNDKECVHHIDENKYNNDIDNLIVFATVADHAGFHKGASIYQVGDVWKAEKSYKIIKRGNTTKREYRDLCPICKKNLKEKHSKMCLCCYNEYKSINIPSKETLLAIILNTPFTTIGKMYGVTDNAVRKWCKKYNLPYTRKDILEYKLNNS